MKGNLLPILLAIGAIATTLLCRDLMGGRELAAVSFAQASEKDKAKKPLPRLKVDKSAPLLLGKPIAAEKPLAGPVADNLACYCCHANYKEEPLAHLHAKADVGCVKCHGESHAHRNDEDNITPPEVMIPLGRIAEACKACHDEHDAPAAKVIARWQQRCPEKTDPGKLVCTDCHGQHRLKARQVRWDKKTGKLITSLSLPASPTNHD